MALAKADILDAIGNMTVLELSGRQTGLMVNADLSGLAITLR